MIVAEPVQGEANAWIIRPGRVVSDVEYALLSNPQNVASLERAIAESLAGEQGTVLA